MDRKEAEELIEAKKLPASEALQKKQEFSPGMKPRKDKFGIPGDSRSPDGRYYDNIEREEQERAMGPGRIEAVGGAPAGTLGGRPEPGAAETDVREGVNIEELERQGQA